MLLMRLAFVVLAIPVLSRNAFALAAAPVATSTAPAAPAAAPLAVLVAGLLATAFGLSVRRLGRSLAVTLVRDRGLREPSRG